MTELTDDQLAQSFKALADPNRIRILKILLASDRELTCGEVSDQLNIAISTVSYHFKILRHAGITNMRKVGHEKLLSINQPVAAQLHLNQIIK
ncbi:ArsR/SmtB family transcription factor [Fructilactobacillus carniphilus]|uniref:Metalloregulator ArsR/SmtB family transcription factor n=1 Tax=Fructilactobacillus carniphilus TaxID=2940297 RepID=A0ABY5BWP9_9LACO|nr:metalloregulator ArsR/SmtB family transcription factor [Fructilactobacillus carniphilus]USS90497.1 metalloregulator ArsR/SmtB family transcription factor [Fructilactobacillus carniphilus]